MISQRELIKEIPSGRFHSALMTSFSINLYYWEIQLLRSLAGKGINFVSALVDSDCLSEQLLKYCQAFSGRKPLDFSLHGYKMKGAFHPKIQFYAGRESVLALIGSGNLTIMGHGRNLEVWCPVLVDNTKSPAYPFVRNVWNYLKGLYLELGPEAENIIRSIEENCAILREDFDGAEIEHFIGDDSIRFFTNQNTSLFNQCHEWIGEERIKTITVMSPFYDSKAELVKALYSLYKPRQIRLIIEDGFGALPKRKSIPKYVKLYKWREIKDASGLKCQDFFHSKCFFFEGEQNHYMLCGSANASVAAFGLQDVKPSNHEACVGFKSKTTDYFKSTGFNLVGTINTEDIDDIVSAQDTTEKHVPHVLWIKEASYIYDSFYLSVDNNGVETNASITFYAGNRSPLLSIDKHIKAGTETISGRFKDAINPLYVEITNNNGELISNRQFMIPTEILEINNPSPESEYKRKKYREIEAGNFVNGEVLKFINSILNGTEKKLSLKADSKTVSDKVIEDTDGFIFNSVEEYLKDNGNSITGDRSLRKGEKSVAHSTMLFDSMISYISRSFKAKEDEDIDEEETEDISKSTGRDKTKSQKVSSKSIKTARNIRDRIIKMFDRYVENLERVALSEKNEKKPVSLLEVLKKYMAAVFFLYRTFSYRYTIENEDNTEHTLIELQHSIDNRKNATVYFYRITSLFGLYLMKSSILGEDNKLIIQRIVDYKQYAFELCLALFSICDCINEGNEDYKSLTKYKALALLNIKDSLCVVADCHTADRVFRRIDRPLQEMDEFGKAQVQQYIDVNIALFNDYSKNCPTISLQKNELFGYVDLKPLNDKVALPCTMACDYDSVKHEYCPAYRYIYADKRTVKVQQT